MDTFIFASPRFSEKQNGCLQRKKPSANGKLSGFVRFFAWLKKVVSEAISSTTRPETEAGPRPIKAGLGDQESGVSGGRQLVKKTSHPLSKWGRSAVSDRATFSDFGCLKMKKSMSYKTV